MTKMFGCLLCDYSDNKASSFYNHVIRSHSYDYKIQIRKLQIAGKYVATWKNELADNKHIRCDRGECNFIGMGLIEFFIHWAQCGRTHITRDPFCQECQSYFSSSKNLQVHRAHLHPALFTDADEFTNLECVDCSPSFIKEIECFKPRNKLAKSFQVDGKPYFDDANLLKFISLENNKIIVRLRDSEFRELQTYVGLDISLEVTAFPSLTKMSENEILRVFSIAPNLCARFWDSAHNIIIKELILRIKKLASANKEVNSVDLSNDDENVLLEDQRRNKDKKKLVLLLVNRKELPSPRVFTIAMVDDESHDCSAKERHAEIKTINTCKESDVNGSDCKTPYSLRKRKDVENPSIKEKHPKKRKLDKDDSGAVQKSEKPKVPTFEKSGNRAVLKYKKSDSGTPLKSKKADNEAALKSKKMDTRTGPKFEKDRCDTAPNSEKTDSVTALQSKKADNEAAPKSRKSDADTGPKSEKSHCDTSPKSEKSDSGAARKSKKADNNVAAKSKKSDAENGPKSEKGHCDTAPNSEKADNGTALKSKKADSKAAPKSKKGDGRIGPNSEKADCGTMPNSEKVDSGSTARSENADSGAALKSEKSDGGSMSNSEKADSENTTKSEEDDGAIMPNKSVREAVPKSLYKRLRSGCSDTPEITTLIWSAGVPVAQQKLAEKLIRKILINGACGKLTNQTDII